MLDEAHEERQGGEGPSVSLVVRRLRRWLAFRLATARWKSCWNGTATRPPLLLRRSFSFGVRSFTSTRFSLPIRDFYVPRIRDPRTSRPILRAACARQTPCILITITRWDERRNYNIPPGSFSSVRPRWQYRSDGPFLCRTCTQTHTPDITGPPLVVEERFASVSWIFVA